MKKEEKYPFIIAEMGVNFYDTARVLDCTPLEAAKLYIDKAAEVGIDCAKFQAYKANTIASKYSPAYWDQNEEPTETQYELFKKYDSFDKNEYIELANYAHAKGLYFTATPFDYDSVDYLEPIVDFYKVASADLSNLPFLEYIASKGKRIVISLGASYLSEVDEAIRTLKAAGCCEENIVLLHCMLSYPTKPENANLAVIKKLKEIYPQLTIGYSDHVAPDSSMLTLTTAYLFGAEVIEKHFTLDKELAGNDHYHSGDPEDFAKVIKNIKYINELIGTQEKTVFDCEIIPRREARRSLVLTRDMKAGEILQKQDLAAKRPGTGISPKYLDIVIGRSVKADLCGDSILQWEHI